MHKLTNKLSLPFLGVFHPKCFTFKGSTFKIPMQATPELYALLTNLLKRTSRLFYSPHDCVILDILMSKTILTDAELLERLHVLPKEFNRLIVRLKEDKLVKIENKIENVEGRQNVKTIYYLDWCIIKDVIKYKVLKISQINHVIVSEMYVCKGCKAEFSILEAQALMRDFHFVCNRCEAFLEEKRADDCDLTVHKRTMDYVKDILELLKQIDEFNVANIDYFQAMKIREEKEGQKEKVIVKQEEEDEEVACETFEEVKPEEKPVEVGIKEIVVVCGVEKYFDEITEDDKQKMSVEEYEMYYDVYSKYYE